LLHDVERIAQSDATVLVVGETGTGKELIARHIHAVSGRRGPFVAVNCGAFSESLIDAELFGHESGAFTGASQARSGWFEAANGGTLFLDEIGDLPLALQVKLLRVLQERQVVRLGSRKAISLDVRLVAATNIDLARAVEAQHFRADLYYRLSVASVRLPPLRERPADIVPLARHFIAMYRSRLSLSDVELSDAAQQALLGYSWAGNIRELENVIHYALIVCRDNVIQGSDIKLVPLSSPSPSHGSVLAVGGLGSAQASASTWQASQAFSAGANGSGVEGLNMPQDGQQMAHLRQGPGLIDTRDGAGLLSLALSTLLKESDASLFDTVESALVHAAFNHAGQNQVRAAKVLGITRNVLRTLLKRHGLLGKSDEDEALDLTDPAQPATSISSALPH